MLGAGGDRVGGIAVASLQYTFYLFIAWSTNSTSQPLPLSSCKQNKRFRPLPVSHNFKSEPKDGGPKKRPTRNSNRCPLLVLESVCWMFSIPHQSHLVAVKMLDSPYWQTMYHSMPLYINLSSSHLENLLNSWFRKGSKSRQNCRHQRNFCAFRLNLKVAKNYVRPDFLFPDVIL